MIQYQQQTPIQQVITPQSAQIPNPKDSPEYYPTGKVISSSSSSKSSNSSKSPAAAKSNSAKTTENITQYSAIVKQTDVDKAKNFNSLDHKTRERKPSSEFCLEDCESCKKSVENINNNVSTELLNNQSEDEKIDNCGDNNGSVSILSFLYQRN